MKKDSCERKIRIKNLLMGNKNSTEKIQALKQQINKINSHYYKIEDNYNLHQNKVFNKSNLNNNEKIKEKNIINNNNNDNK